MTETCLHQPKPNPGRVCNCPSCRTARMKVFNLILPHCVRCAGRCATDSTGQLTCEKGNYQCPLLDLWYSILNREADPAKFDVVKVELVLHGRVRPPKRYRRVAPELAKGSKMIPDPTRNKCA